MVNDSDLLIIWSTVDSSQENETLFQSWLKNIFFKMKLRDPLSTDKIESFLEEFEISVSTLRRWMQGTSAPNENVQDLIVLWWKKQMESR